MKIKGSSVDLTRWRLRNAKRPKPEKALGGHVRLCSHAQSCLAGGQPGIGVGVKRFALAYVWITIALSGVVFSEPAPCDALMVGAIVLLPVVGLTRFTPGIAFYLMLWALIVVGGFIAVTQAGEIEVPIKHMSITLYLALSSVVMAAFVLDAPAANIRLIMSAYLVAALVAAIAGFIGYFSLVPGAHDLFAPEFGRVRGTFKDPNVLGAFLVPPLLYVLNSIVRSGVLRSGFAAACRADPAVGLPARVLARRLGQSRRGSGCLCLFGLRLRGIAPPTASAHHLRDGRRVGGPWHSRRGAVHSVDRRTHAYARELGAAL